MTTLIYVAVMTLLPFFELRWSIPFGIYMGTKWMWVVLVATSANLILGPVVFIALHNFLKYVLKVDFLKDFYEKVVLNTQDRVKNYVDKYGLVGMAMFVGLPLPGSGSYTGALGAFLLGFRLRSFILANTLGVLFASFIVTAISLGVLG